MKPATLVEALCRARRFPGTGLRLLDRHERPTFLEWAEVYLGAQRVSRALRTLGIARGERVALVLPTGADFFHGFFGALLAGAVPVPLYPPVRLGRLDEYHARTARMLEASGAQVVLTDRRVRRLLGESVARARPPHGCRVVSDLLAETAADPGAPVAPAPDELALVQFSSGTTVDPKPVALSHAAILAQVHALNACWPDAEGVAHAGMSWLPLYHDMGLIGCVFPALERPAVLTLLGPEVFVARPAAWLRAISRWRATISPAPNFAYGLCVERIRDDELAGVDLSCWQFALCGAEPVAPSVLRAFQDRFARFGLRPEALSPVYGLAEAALAVTFTDLRRPFGTRRFDREKLARTGEAHTSGDGRELVSLGRPLPGFDVRIRDAAGTELPEGRVGGVYVRGPSLMHGYLGRPDLTGQVLRDGWLDTGDLGFLNGGELFLTGRAKDVLIVRGRNHAPEEIEHAVDGLPGLRTGCCAAVSHLPEGGEAERVLLLAERARDASAEAIAALPAACRRAVLAATGVALFEVVVLEPGTLPRTSSGKIRRREALERHLAGSLAPPKPVSLVRMLGAMGRSRLSLARYEREARRRGAAPPPEPTR